MEKAFFGLTEEYRESLLEEYFVLNQQMNLAISEIKNLPIRIRHWFIKRIIRKNEKISQTSSPQKQKSDTQKPAKNIDINKVDKFFAKFDI